MRERDYYPRVARWAERQLGCYYTAVDSGLKLGRIDVVGLRDTGGNLSGRAEVISIEVKREGQPFAKSVGQASGYAIFADRCYLAEVRQEAFSEDEVAIAARLSVGLIRISGEKRIRITETLSAPAQEPLEGLRLRLIDHLGFAVCTFCSSIFELGDDPASKNYVVKRGDDTTSKSIERAVANDKGLMYWLLEQHMRQGRVDDTVFHRRHVCSDCVWALFGHLGTEATDDGT